MSSSNGKRYRPAGVAQHLFEFFTHDELKLLLAVVFTSKAQETHNAYNLTRYATPTPETKGPTDDWTELVLRAARYLSFEHGVAWSGVNCRPNGSVTADRVVEPRNYLYVAVMKAGGMPDIDVILPKAIEYARHHVPSLPLEPMRTALAELEAEFADRLSQVDPATMEAVTALREWAMEQARVGLEGRPPTEKPGTIH